MREKLHASRRSVSDSLYKPGSSPGKAGLGHSTEREDREWGVIDSTGKLLK